MLYLSQLLNAAVDDLHSERVGKLIDVVIPATHAADNTPVYPTVLLVEGDADRPWRVPLTEMERHAGQMRLRVPVEQLAAHPAEPDPDAAQEVYLAQEVLDKQVIDIKHKKAVRVNDIVFDDNWRILGVDHSTLGLIRRIAPAWLLGTNRQHLPPALIPWEQIELIGNSSQNTVPAQRTPSGHLADLHPADIAEIVHQLTPGQGARIIEGLDDETAADTMEEIDTERQRHILENIQAERAADILQSMGPDEAADLLARMPEEYTQRLLRLMTPEESEDVQELLEYEENTAGGLMTTDFIILNQTRTVEDALREVRINIQENDLRSPYIYCVEDESQDECHILGIVSLWDLLVATPTQHLQELMESDLITVEPDSDAQSVAEIMAKYNLLAVPVVNNEGNIQGIVTVDDALDVLLPANRRRKPKKMY